MVNIIHKKHLRLLFKSPKENIIYKIIHGKNYEKLYKLLFKTHGNQYPRPSINIKAHEYISFLLTTKSPCGIKNHGNIW